MTNKYKYFIANWKMYGDIKSVNSTNKVIKLIKAPKFKKAKIVYCPPFTLLNDFVQKLKKSRIEVGAQNCHQVSVYGAYTGSISSTMIKDLGCKYIILGHSENRATGETNELINKKIKISLKNKLTVILCIGENILEKKSKNTKKILGKQITKSLKGINNIDNVIFAYEPIWSIGTGVIPKLVDLKNNISFIKKFLINRLKFKKSRVLYGGSVNPENIIELKDIYDIDGFLIGGASQKSNKFIDIIKKTFN